MNTMPVTLDQLAKGTEITFVKYAEGEPTDGVILKKGDALTVVSAEETQDGIIDVVAELPNPDFNAKKKVSKANAKTVQVNLWDDEIALAEAAPKTKTKGKTRAKPRSKAATEEVSEEKPATKKAATKKPAAKKAAAKKPAKEKAAAKAKEPAAPAPYVPEWEALKTEDAEITALVEEAGEGLLDLVKETVEDRGSMDYRLGGLLYHIALDGTFEAEGEEYVGAKGFTKYCEEVLEIGYRKAKYLVNIYYQFNKLGIAGEKVAKIGWTKARAIAETASIAESDEAVSFTKKDANALVKMASSPDTTVKSLDEHIKATYRSGDAVKEKFLNIKISVPEIRGTQLLDIIEAAKEQFETEDTSEAVAKILEEWSMEMAEG